MFRIESYVSNPPAFPKFAEKIGNYLDLNIGSCIYFFLQEYVDSPGSASLVSNAKFLFSTNVSLFDRGALCQFSGYGESFFVKPTQNSIVRIERRPGKPPRIQNIRGLVKIISDQLHLEWNISGALLKLKSTGPIVLSIAQRSDAIMLNIELGILEVTPAPHSLANLGNPVLISTKSLSKLQSEGKVLGEKGETLTLLPSGFSKEMKPSAAQD